MKTHKDYLDKQMRDGEFAEEFRCERQKLRIDIDKIKETTQ